MSRRASSGISPGLLIGVAVAVVAVFFGGKALLNKKAPSLQGSTLSIEDYKDHGNQLRGNEYLVEGVVDEQRVSDEGNGRVVFLRVDSNGGKEFLGVKIPSDLVVQNIEREQRYSFKVRIEKQGVPIALAVNRL